VTTLITEGFHHITMVSSDAQRTLDFYRDLLGVRLVKRTVNFDDPEAYHLYFGDPEGTPGSILTFFEWPRSPRGHWGVGGVHHLALSVPTAEAQLKWKRRLEDAGVQVSGPINRGYFTSLYFVDPDGQILEIATAGPGYAIDEPADALGQSLRPPPVSLQRDEEAMRSATHPEPVPAVTDDMLLTGIHHITGITDDLDRAGDFYEEALGLKPVKKTVNQDDGETLHYFWANYDGDVVAPRSSLTLFGWGASTQLTRPGAGQTHHIAFRAPSDDAQQSWREHLLSMGLDVSPVMERSYFRSIYFSAPDGMILEIATDGPGFSLDEPIESLGADLRLPSWLEERKAQIAGKLTPLI